MKSRAPRRAALWTGIALLVVLVIAAGLMQRVPQLHAYVEVQGPESLRITFLQRQSHGSYDLCQATVGRIARTMKAQCPNCRVLEKRCLDQLDARQRKILSGQPLDIPVMRMPGGVVAFMSGEPGLADKTCQESERRTPGSLQAQCDASGPDGIELSLARIGGGTDATVMPGALKLLGVALLAAAVSLLVCFLIIRSEALHGRFSHDRIAGGPQKFHSTPTPRIGGVALAAALAASVLLIEGLGWLNAISAYGLSLLALSAIPAFVGGLGEDVTRKVGVLARLMLTFAAGIFASLLVGATLDRLDVPGLDRLLQWPVFAIAFTAFAVGGIANSINLTDGYNGLAGGYSVIVLAALAWVAGQVGDPVVLTASLVMLGALLGFLYWNYPRGRIFMGDGGAYLLGFWLAELSVLLVVRNPDVSPWFPLLLLAYPVVDTLFSIYRRKILRGRSVGRADAVHLHQLIYRRLARVAVGSKNVGERRRRNNLVVLYICAGAIIFTIPALFAWSSTPWLVALGLVYWATYLRLYYRLARWKAPTWLIIAPKVRGDY